MSLYVPVGHVFTVAWFALIFGSTISISLALLFGGSTLFSQAR